MAFLEKYIYIYLAQYQKRKEFRKRKGMTAVVVPFLFRHSFLFWLSHSITALNSLLCSTHYYAQESMYLLELTLQELLFLISHFRELENFSAMWGNILQQLENLQVR